MTSDLALDRVLLDVPDRARAQAAYDRLLGARAGPEPRVSNGAVQLGLPAWAPRPGLVFSTGDFDGALRLLRRRGLPLDAVEDSRRTAAGEVDGFVYGLVERGLAAPLAGDISAIDHVVILASRLSRVVATLGGRLGLDLRLEQRLVKAARQLFFRCDNTVVEVLVKPSLPGAKDSLWGVAWRTADIEATHARLVRAGVGISEVRQGLKPGTRVATVKDPDLATPSLLIEQRAG